MCARVCVYRWVDATKKLGVMANADTPADAAAARRRGAEGVGLCRTEHMFFSSAQRIAAVRRMIAATELHSPQVRVCVCVCMCVHVRVHVTSP